MPYLLTSLIVFRCLWLFSLYTVCVAVPIWVLCCVTAVGQQSTAQGERGALSMVLNKRAEAKYEIYRNKIKGMAVDNT